MANVATNEPKEARIVKSRKIQSRLSLAWLLPILAIVCSGWILWKAYSERGPLVRIEFDNAGGVKAGETRIRRNDVDVGTVEAVRLSEDLDSVIVEARLDPQVSRYLDDNTRFWIVNAEINTTEISGLSTLLSGSYIEVDWDDNRGERQSEFMGLSEPPLTKRGTPGLRLSLTAEESGYINVGSPVLHRQIDVGRVERRRLSPDAKNVVFDIFIEAPYHEFVFPATRFFSVSGIESNIGADGAYVRVESVVAFLIGGIAFENPVDVDGMTPVAANEKQFKVFDNRAAAQDSLFDGEDDEGFRYLAEFKGSVKGLRADAIIEYNGLRVGRVIEVNARLPRNPGAESTAIATLQFQPRRLGMLDVTPERLHETLERFIDNGLRVQLASGNLLTGSLIVKLVDIPEAAAAEIDNTSEPYPTLPTIDSDIDGVTADVETLVKNLSELPLSSLVNAATGLLSDTRGLINSPDVSGIPAQISTSLESISRAVSRMEQASEDLPTMLAALTSASQNANDVLEGLSPDSEIYIELAATVRELKLAAKSIAAFAALLEENPNAVFTGR